MQSTVQRLYGEDVTVFTAETLAEYLALPHPVVVHFTPEVEAEIRALLLTGEIRSGEKFYERVARLYAEREANRVPESWEVLRERVRRLPEEVRAAMRRPRA